MKYKAVIFDFFGVVCDERFWQWVSKHIPNYREHTGSYQILADKADKGDISKKEFYERIGQDAGVRGETVRREIHDEIRVHDDVVSIVRRLHKSCKTAILSNADYRALERIISEHDLREHFDEVVISTRVKLIKPDPAIFRLTCERLAVSPDEAVFIDDREANLIGAKKAGLSTILFSDALALEKALAQSEK